MNVHKLHKVNLVHIFAKQVVSETRQKNFMLNDDALAVYEHVQWKQDALQF